MNKYVDKTHNFIELFDPKTGFYVRSGVIKDGIDTNVDPFMRSFPFLLDIGIMNKCVCANKCNVDCYQKAIDRTGANMSVENYEKIMRECEHKVGEVALGGAGDVDTHENFEEILSITNKYGIVPNFTTSGILMNKQKAEICKKYCGAIAVSQHSKLQKTLLKKAKDKLTENEECFNSYIENVKNLNELISQGWSITNEIVEDNCYYKEVYYEEDNYTYNAIKTLLDANVKTSIHYVLSKNSIDEAIFRLKNNSFPKDTNAVIFLLYKPIGLGKHENVLDISDTRLKEFFDLIDTQTFNFKIGFDSCSIPGILNLTSQIDKKSIDSCEGGRFSAYVTPDMKLLPCSFDNQAEKWAVDLNTHTIQEAWDSELFNEFRSHFNNSCKSCKDRLNCYGGCPICRNIVLCNRTSKDLHII